MNEHPPPTRSQKLRLGLAIALAHFVIFLVLYGFVAGAAFGGGNPIFGRLVLFTLGLPLSLFQFFFFYHGLALASFIANSVIWGIAGGLWGWRLWRRLHK